MSCEHTKRLPPRETQQLARKVVAGEQAAGRFSLREHATTSEVVAGEQAEGRLPPREHAAVGEDFAGEQAGGGRPGPAGVQSVHLYRAQKIWGPTIFI